MLTELMNSQKNIERNQEKGGKETMNLCIMSGRLIQNATVRGSKKRALSFRLATEYAYNSEKNRPYIEFVPCVIFDAPDKLEKLMVERGKGLLVELHGRLAGRSYETNGQRKFDRSVVVSKGSMKIMKN